MGMTLLAILIKTLALFSSIGQLPIAISQLHSIEEGFKSATNKPTLSIQMYLCQGSLTGWIIVDKHQTIRQLRLYFETKQQIQTVSAAFLSPAFRAQFRGHFLQGSKLCTVRVYCKSRLKAVCIADFGDSK